MKALFVPFAPSLAHVSRCLAVAEAWQARGHTAILATGAERAPMAQAAGLPVHSLPEVAGAVFRADRGFRWLSAGYFEQNLIAELEIVSKVKPHIVVFDFRFTTASAARLAGVPSVSILHGNALRLALRPRETAQLLVGDPGQARGIASARIRLMRHLFPIIFQTIMRLIARRVVPVLKAHNLPPASSPFEWLLGDDILIADLPEFLPPALSPNCHVVGPLMWSGWEQSALWLDELDARPLVYVTLGSTVEGAATLVKIVDALRDAPYNVVVSTGGLSLPELQLPPHIRVFPTVPGAAVIRRSALVFHHGGHETLMQALTAGAPSWVAPANADQVLVAQQVQSLGIGRSLWRPNGLPMGTTLLRDMTPAQIVAGIDDLIADEECRRICQTFQRKIAALCGATAAAETIEGAAARRSST